LGKKKDGLKLYFVMSPFQVLSALEAYSLKPDGKHLLIVKIVESGRNAEQMKRVLELWPGEVLHWNNGKVNLIHPVFADLFALLSCYKYRNKVHLLYLGDFRDLTMHRLRAVIKPDEVVMLDDGTATIEICANYLSRQIYSPLSIDVQNYKHLLKLVLYGLWDLNKGLKKCVNLLTCFDVEDYEGKIYRHTFESIRQRKGEKRTLRGVVYFFGSKFAEKGVMSLTDEVNFLFSVNLAIRSDSKNMVYVPHRADSDEKLELIKNIGIPIKVLDGPAEIELILGDVLPQEFASATSTLIQTLRILFPEIPMTSYQMPVEKLLPEFKQRTLGFYSYYETQGINIKAF